MSTELHGLQMADLAQKRYLFINLISGEHAQTSVEIVPLALASEPQNGEKVISHFEKHGFRCEGEAEGATTFPASLALPADSGLWQVMRRSFGDASTAVHSARG